MRPQMLAFLVFLVGGIVAATAVAGPSAPTNSHAPSSQFLMQTQAPSTALPILSQVRASEAVSQQAPAGQVYVESLPATPPPFAADPNDQGPGANQQEHVVHRTQPVSRALPSKRFGPNEAMSALNVTGINHWWTYEEDSIGGVGRYMVNVATGNLIVQADDMAIPHKGISLAFRRTYNSYSQHDYANTDGSVPDNYGDGWTNTFDAHIAQNTLNDPHCGKTGISVYDVDGARYDYAIQYSAQTNSCSYIAPIGQFAALTFDVTSGLYYWTKTSGTVYMFHNPTDANVGVAGRLSKIWARNNNCTLTFTYTFDSGQTKSAATLNKIMVQTESTGGASLTATLTFRTFTGINQSTHRLLSTLAWPDGTTVTYNYDSSGRLSEVDEPAKSPGGSSIPQIYTYGSGGYLLATVAGGRWSTSNGSDGATTAFDYSASSVIDAKYYAWVNPMVPDPSGTTLLQSAVASNYGTVAGTPYRFVTFSQWGAGPAPSPAPTSSPSAAPAACSSTGAMSWYDSDGHEAILCYDASGRVVQNDDWTGSQWLVTKQGWDSNDDLVSTIDARNNETDYAYDATGNLIAQAAPSTSVIYNGNSVSIRSTWLYSYDVHNNLTAKCDPVVVHAAGKDWSSAPPVSDTLCSTANGLSHFMSFTWNTNNSYELYGELSAATTALGYTSSVSYASASQGGADYGLPTSVQGANFSQAGSTTTPLTSFTYDSFGNVICASRALSASQSSTVAFKYDSDNRILQAADPDDGSPLSVNTCGKPSNSNTIINTTTYNPNGSIATTQSPSEAAAGVTTQFGYDWDGNKTSEVDHFGGIAGTTSDYYDGAERLIEVVKPYDANSDTTFPNLPWMTRYDYDLSAGGANGTDTVTTGGTNSHTYTVAGHGNLFQTQMAVDTTTFVTGPTGSPYWAPTQFDSFDAMDRPVADYRPKPKDCLSVGSPVAGAVADCDDFIEATHIYDASTSTLGFQTSTLQGPNVPEIEYVYDATGRVSSQNSQNIAERTYAVDADGRDAQVTLAGVGTESMTYDFDGREVGLTEAPAVGFTAPTTYTYSYYGNGWRSGVTAQPSGSTTPINYSYTYRWDGKQSTTSFAYASDSYTFSYHLTPGGRETSMDDPYYPGPSPSPTATPGVDARYETYDSHGRLQTATIPEGSYSGIGYDAEGNIAGYSVGAASIVDTYNVRGELYKETSSGTTVLAYAPILGYDNTTSPADVIDIRAGVKTGSVVLDTGGVASVSTYGNRGEEVNVATVFTVKQGNQYQQITGNDARTYDDTGHLLVDNFSNWNCSGDPFFQGGLSNAKATYVWGPNGHPITSTLVNFGGTSETESLHWSDDELMFTTDASGNVDDIKIGTLADYVPSAATSSRLTVWDRDLSGYIASAHNGTGKGTWEDQAVEPSVCTSQTNPQRLYVGAQATQGFAMPTGLAKILTGNGLGSFPTGLFVANRPDGISNQFSTIQGARAYDPGKNDWMTPDALASATMNPALQRAYMYDANNPVSYSDPTGFYPRPMMMNGQIGVPGAADGGSGKSNGSGKDQSAQDQELINKACEALIAKGMKAPENSYAHLLAEYLQTYLAGGQDWSNLGISISINTTTDKGFTVCDFTNTGGVTPPTQVTVYFQDLANIAKAGGDSQDALQQGIANDLSTVLAANDDMGDEAFADVTVAMMADYSLANTTTPYGIKPDPTYDQSEDDWANDNILSPLGFRRDP